MEDKKGQEMTKQERMLFLNAGHGPPIGRPPDFYSNKGPKAASFVQKSNSEEVFHPNSTHAALSVHDNSQRMMFVPPSGMVRPYMPDLYENGFHPEVNSAYNERQTPKENDELLWRMNHHLKHVQGGDSQIDILLKQNECLRREVALKSDELKDLKAKLCQLTEPLNALPEFSAEIYPDDRLIHLTTTNGLTGAGCWTEKQLEDDEDLMKSAQCSELSIEQQNRNDYNGEKTERAISSASSTSFEVVNKEFCADPKSSLEGGELKRLNFECYVDSKQLKNCEDQIRLLKSQLQAFQLRLDSEKSQRLEGEAKISKRLDEISNVPQGARSRSAESAEPLGITSQDCCCSEVQELTQKVSEITAANWKVTEQAKELKRENDELKNRVQELGSCAATVDVKKLEEELRRRSTRVVDLETQLRMEHQRLLEAESRITQLQLDPRNTHDFLIQQGTDETTIELNTENSLLKCQIETFKEDFEVERRDREKLISDRDTLTRYYETLNNDLCNARQQLRKYEDDITSLRSDNTQMRNRLWDVTESGLKDTKTIPLNKDTHALSEKTKPASRPQNFLMPKSSSALAGQSSNLECRACTFKNPAQRGFCEMCGTQMDEKSSAASRGPAASNISSNWNATAQPTPLLSNLRNYGDIETD